MNTQTENSSGAQSSNVNDFLEALLNEDHSEVVRKAVQTVAIGMIRAEAAQLAIERISMADDLEPKDQFFSVGFACQILGCTPDQLRAAMKAGGVKMDHARNDVAYLTGSTLVVAGRHLPALPQSSIQAQA